MPSNNPFNADARKSSARGLTGRQAAIMTTLLRFVAVFVAFAGSMPASHAQSPDCSKDLDACVVHAVAENATFIVECAKLYPKSKDMLESALAGWSVIKLPIPGIAEATNADSSVRRSLSDSIGSYLRRIPGHEREIECAGRFEMMKEAEPKLMADSVRLPPNALRRYLK